MKVKTNKESNDIMYGLIGKALSHSYSKIIHEKISSIEYTLIELDDIHDFFTAKEFSAVNVTIPYKKAVMPYLDYIDDLAKEIGNVNTVVNVDSKLYGYNTDYYGLERSLQKNSILLKNKNILIVGNGSTSRLVRVLCEHHNVANITVLARNPQGSELSFSDSFDQFDINLVFNTTPYGMYPNLETTSLIDLEGYPNVEGVVDLVYNPLNTMLIQDAKRLNIKTLNGLEMLVNQAVKANELFLHTKYKSYIYRNTYKELLFETINFVLIGMPMSGKSHFSRLLGKKYNRTVVDIDRLIESKEGKSIIEIFKEHNEKYFRNLEDKYSKETAINKGIVISTGGGTVLNKEAMSYLKSYGLTIFIDAPLDMLLSVNPKGRPLLDSKEKIISLYNYRYPIYNTCTDIKITKKNFNEMATLNQIEVKLNEYFNS